MPPRKSNRSTKSTAPSPAPLRELKSEGAKDTLQHAEEAVADVQAEEQQKPEVVKEELANATRGKSGAKGKGKAKEVVKTAVVPAAEAEAEEDEEDEAVEEPASAALHESATASTSKMTAEERLAKLKELRMKMSQSTAANRRDLVADYQKSRTSAKEISRLEKQRKIAENLREKIEAEETGEDLERRKHWEWTIEDNDKWDEKMTLKKEKSEFEFDDIDAHAQRKYIKDLTKVKPDLHAYNLQKEAALGLPPGTLVPTSLKQGLVSTSTRQALASTSKALSAAESLYRDANTLSYGDSKPSEEAIDRVVGKMNAETAAAHKKKRNRDDDDGEVTYINEQNKVFNKKINRYFDKYTAEIRANFERGTAL